MKSLNSLIAKNGAEHVWVTDGKGPARLVQKTQAARAQDDVTAFLVALACAGKLPTGTVLSIPGWGEIRNGGEDKPSPVQVNLKRKKSPPGGAE